MVQVSQTPKIRRGPSTSTVKLVLMQRAPGQRTQNAGLCEGTVTWSISG